MNLKILQAIDAEYERAKIKYPLWPSDPVHAIAIAWEEKGELIQACNDHVHPQSNHLGDDTLSRMYKEAVQMGVTAIRFLENMEAYSEPGRRVRAPEQIENGETIEVTYTLKDGMEIRTRWPEIKPEARRSSFVCGESVSHSEMVDYIRGDAMDVDDDLK